MRKEKRSFQTRGFGALLAAQALSVFNENAFRALAALLLVITLPPAAATQFIAAAGLIFILPYLLLSAAAGAVADRFGKKNILVACQAAGLGLMLLSVYALPNRNIPLLIGILVCLGALGAFISPAKLAIIPELVTDEDLSHANGLMQLAAFAGIIAGTLAAAWLAGAWREQLLRAGLALTAAALAGLAAALLIPEIPAARDASPISWNFAAQAWDNLRRIRRRRGVFLSLVGLAYFWFLCAIFQMNLMVYGRQLMRLDEHALGLFQIVVALGIAAGSYAAGRLSRGKVELGLVPLGAVGLVLFTADLTFAADSPIRASLDLFLAGASGGGFALPLIAYVQENSPAQERGRAIAMGNVLALAAVLLASGWLWLFSDYFKLHPQQVFLAVAAMTAAVAAYIVRMLPDFFLRLLLYPIVNLVYRIQVKGHQHLPVEGPALLVSNHVSYVDPFMIAGASPRLVRFLAARSYYELPVLNWFFRAMGAIPVSYHDSPKTIIQSFEAARQSLQDGEIVCIFAEGEITRHGQMLRFRKGMEHIAAGLDIPIIPVHLDRLWGSVFSFAGRHVLLKKPRRFPYPVTVSFGAALPSHSKAEDIRQAIQELGADAFAHRLEEKQSLALAFAREAKRRWFSLAMADANSGELSCGSALVRAYLLGRALDKVLPASKTVGLLLPPCVPAALANLGLSLRGRRPVNLNYTGSHETALGCARRARVAAIVTSRKFLEKINWPTDESMVFLEDVAPRIKPRRAALTAAAFFVLPARLLELFFLRKAARNLAEPATIIFTSGSTGEPKGVLLSHANIHANIEALAQVYQLGAEDRMLGALPFFHSFGYTVTLWMPAVVGFAAIYHPNPLDAKGVGALIARHGATILPATPTFLMNYLRRIEPDQMRSLSLVIAGAEKLREDVARAFADRFGVMPLEGYGCSELSPVATVNIPDAAIGKVRQKGAKLGTIGQPLPGVAVRVVNPDTGAPVAQGEPGLLLVKGPNVMMGYLDNPDRTEEVLKDGYYATGDMGSMDADGFVTITDRLSRFSKIGGEMVPHIRLEERLHELAGVIEQSFVVSAVPDPKKGERLVVLYKDYEDLEGLWRKLNESDSPKLWIPEKSCFHKVEQFPLLGSGKLDLVALKKTAQELEARKPSA